jgi:primosomal protein N' (replication factor Y)
MFTPPGQLTYFYIRAFSSQIHYNGKMRYYEVFVADSRYHSNAPLTYSSEEPLQIMNAVAVQLRQQTVTGFVISEVDKPDFSTKPIRALISKKPLPAHSLELARWLSEYYSTNLSEALRQFAPTKPTLRHKAQTIPEVPEESAQMELEAPLTKDQAAALKLIHESPSTTILLHGHTGTGKTRVYIELAKKTIKEGKSVILLTPEIALTSQLTAAVSQQLGLPVFLLHSQLTQASRKRIWLDILQSEQPVVIIGPRSALFSPVHNLGLVVLDEAHEPAYKQDQSPRYHAVRVASQLGLLTQAKVILGSATPNITDYYLAEKRNAVVGMKQRAIAGEDKTEFSVIDLKDRGNFTSSPHLSKQLIEAITDTLKAKKQVMVYLNRRGSARLILCNNCGWQLLCPNCDIPLVYHGDNHTVRCHICGHHAVPPSACPECKNPDIIYKSIGTKALTEEVNRLFPGLKIQRFDSDNTHGERLDQIYHQLLRGEIDILVGTQLLAKGLDLPRLGLVGIISAETSLSLPDYSSEERSFQLLYQVIGRVGRGHGKGRVILQSYEPNSIVVQAAIHRDWEKFYKYALDERQKFRFPPSSYLMQLTCRRATLKGVEQASLRLRKDLLAQKLSVEIIGPTPSFYARRGKYYYWQIVIKSKRRDHLLELAKIVPADWTVDLDPINLL